MNKNKIIAALTVALLYKTYQGAQKTNVIKRMVDLNLYYANKLDDAGVALDEFDQIAINNI